MDPLKIKIIISLDKPDRVCVISSDINMILKPACKIRFSDVSGEIMLGDIVISVDKVLEQAESYGHTTKREYAFLIVHSMLHLFGYDHMTPEEAAVMEAKQKQILDEMNITR